MRQIVTVGLGGINRGRVRLYLAAYGSIRTIVFVSDYLECGLAPRLRADNPFTYYQTLKRYHISALPYRADGDGVQLRWIYEHKDGRNPVFETCSHVPKRWREFWQNGFPIRKKSLKQFGTLEWSDLELSIPLQP